MLNVLKGGGKSGDPRNGCCTFSAKHAEGRQSAVPEKTAHRVPRNGSITAQEEERRGEMRRVAVGNGVEMLINTNTSDPFAPSEMGQSSRNVT